jgi:predicted thioredoxin/glutaredoxin
MIIPMLESLKSIQSALQMCAGDIDPDTIRAQVFDENNIDNAKYTIVNPEYKRVIDKQVDASLDAAWAVHRSYLSILESRAKCNFAYFQQLTKAGFTQEQAIQIVANQDFPGEKPL